jgi:hypothetical protein
LPSLLQHLPARITMNTTIDYDTPLAILTFPLNTTLVWNLSSTNFSLNGKVKCLWFNVINFLNKIAKLFGNEFLPPEVAALLPDIDIKEALTTLASGNVINIPAMPDAFFCLNTENVTVPAGTYNAYNITLVGGLAQCFYAPTAGNVVKISGNFVGVLPNLKSFNMELISTNFS